MGYVIVVDEKGRREILGDVEQYQREEFGNRAESSGKRVLQEDLDEKDKAGE